MPEAVNYIVYSIPVFFLLIGVEILIDKARKTGYYRLNDALSNINAGITEQVTGAFLKTFVVGLYAWTYDHMRIASIPDNIVMWIILFIGVDFFYYWFHRLAHEINVLWGGHVVHHQSEEYNLSVALRQGAFQKFGSFLFYLPLALIGFNPVMFIVVSQFQTLYQFWIHTKVVNKLPAPFEFILNTPSHHRVHHGRNPKYIDKNHGGTLIIWDRMFGTFQNEEEEVIYGITKPLKTWNPLRAQLDFWRDLWHDLARTPGIGDKIKLLLLPPGWYPAVLGGPQTPPSINKQTEKKFDTHISMAMNTYVFIQFVITLGITSWFLFTYETMTLSSGLIVMAFVLISITATGLLLEGNRWAVFVERLRLIGLPLVFFYLHYIGFFGIIPVRYYNPLLAYVVVSLIIFTFILRRNSLHVKNIK
ncbi:MAG TPA: sterol desaturase family protein [Chitinophagales bacterium]|nr:sterol desaturase family protein [Chitinophagales bacterium]HNK98622.1 sterol desaturase family protein [Chitinophagales bacterium]